MQLENPGIARRLPNASTHKRVRRWFPGLAVLLLTLATSGSSAVAVGQNPAEKIVVELRSPAATVVAAHEAGRLGLPFDESAHARAVQASQTEFLQALVARGVPHLVTTTTLGLAGGPLVVPNRFDYLINAIGLEVPLGTADAIRAMPEVKWVTPDEPVQLHLDRSVRYLRASDGPGNKTIFTQSGGPLTRFDGSGQVVAILDTGIEHTHPAFDTRFPDDAYQQRAGDVRPVRLAGQPYVDGVNHPKVVYSLTLTAATAEDDVGHGTHGAVDAAGVKVLAPGPDRLPNTADDQIVEGVAPGALLMNYKICETVFTCVGTANIVTALTDAVRPTDPAGNRKPRATVINMSFGGTAGNPNDANATAASNAALAGAVPVASAGNAGPGENTVGSPSVGRRVISVAAMNDPGVFDNELDVLAPNPLRYTAAGMSTGGQNDANADVSPEDRHFRTLLMAGAPDVTFPLGQHFVYVGVADTPDQVPDAVKGRIALASRGSTAEAGGQGTGTFGHKAAEVAAKGAIALLIFNNVPGDLEAATTTAAAIPVYGLSKANGEYLRDAIGFSGTFNKDDRTTWGVISRLPIRLEPPDPATFAPSTTGFSSRGPTDTFEVLKPDVTAPGQNVYSGTIPAGGARAAVPPQGMSDPSRYISASGTSFSGPQVAGAAALVREAMLATAGLPPADPVQLRSGAAAAYQQTQNTQITADMIRSALINTATPIRASDGETPMPEGSRGAFIHETGAGLIHVRNAVGSHAQLGVATADEFRPTHSFGTRAVINTGQQNQVAGVTVTLRNVTGVSGAGTYSLALIDGGSQFGMVTRPFDATPGFQVSLSTGAVVLSAGVGNEVSFSVTAVADGSPTSGLRPAGADVTGTLATEFLWVLVATGPDGQRLRMPFYYRAVPQAYTAPVLQAIADDAERDQVNGIDLDGNYRLSWTFPDLPVEQPCAFSIEEATLSAIIHSDDASELLVAGANSRWSGAAQWNSAPHRGTGTLGYHAPYADSQNIALAMRQAIQLPAGTKAQLVFDSFEDIDAGVDTLRIEVSRNGGAFAPVTAFSGSLAPAGSFAGRRFVDLSDFAGDSIRIAFRMITGGTIFFFDPANLGWTIDNIQIQTANFASAATVAGATRSYDVTSRPSGRYSYRVRGLFGPACTAPGPASNVQEIAVQSTLAPTAAFTVAPNPAIVGETVTFDATTSQDNDEGGCCIARYFWAFGDGATQTTTEPVTTHTYAQPGSYRALLVVTDDDDESDAEELLVEVVSTADISGGGWIPVGGAKANFAFDFQRQAASGVTGHLKYRDHATNTRIASLEVHAIDVDGNRAIVRGSCAVDGQSGFTFELTVTDGGSSSRDHFRIQVSNGYTAAGTLGGGDIVIAQ